jgi:uncharacterized protein with HEPN domain
MKDEVRKYLFDILTSIESVEDFLGEKRIFADYQSNRLLKRGIEREIEIIGEAISKILKLAPEISITNARRIVDTRNWVIHSYDNVDDIIIWGIVVNHLPKLKQEVTELINKK